MPATQYHLHLDYLSKTKAPTLSQSTTNNILSCGLRLFPNLWRKWGKQPSIVLFRHHSLLYEVQKSGILICARVTLKVPYRLLCQTANISIILPIEGPAASLQKTPCRLLLRHGKRALTELKLMFP